jgi:uncharacterized protein YdiU (UPF0061 family)
VNLRASPLLAFDNSFARELPELCVESAASLVPEPQLVLLNEQLAVEIGFDPDLLRSGAGLAFLVGNAPPAATSPVAQAYAGHQFGGFSPVLGDGRALLLGETVDVHGRRRDLHLKGSGRTPFSRGGDGKAAIGPMLREYLMGEAMDALAIPTTRALAVVATGEKVLRDTPLPGAVLARVAASHLRVGTFQYAALQGGPALVRRLADYAITRHYPDAADEPNPYLAFLGQVIEAQASLVAKWMLVGFVHGVMNTDNMTISGATIDYGPCAFMERFDLETVFSSIDHGGRYAYGNQPRIAHWNLTRFAETLLPLLDPDETAAVAAATTALQSFGSRYDELAAEGLRAKLGLRPGTDDGLVNETLTLLAKESVDFTSFFRALAKSLRGDTEPLRALVNDAEALDGWLARWHVGLPTDQRDATAIADAMDRVNPVYIPRNHKVEQALAAATAGDLVPLHRLLEVLADPFVERPERAEYAAPAPPSSVPYRTFCGT